MHSPPTSFAGLIERLEEDKDDEESGSPSYASVNFVNNKNFGETL